MKKIGLFYGSTSGKTEGIVDEIAFDLGVDVDVFNVKDGIKDISLYENLIFALPTYGVAELQSDWNTHFEEFKTLNLRDKTIALVGVGNQTTFGESFVGALVPLYEAILAQNGTIIGLTSTDGYHYEECDAIINNEFMGLILDEENQDYLTPDRIYDWLEDIKPKFK